MPRRAARGIFHPVVPPLDLHFVAPGLAVGAAFGREQAARLAREHGITRVVDLRAEARDDEHVLRLHGITLLHLPTRDCCAVSQDMLRDGVAFVSEGLDRGEKALVHCQWGIGRSALLALCVLVDRGEAPLAALARAKGARAVVSPSPEQLEAFLAFSGAVKVARGAAWILPDLDALAAIAWRHLRAEETDLEAARAGSTGAG